MPSSTPLPSGAHVPARAPTPVYCGGREPLFLAAVAFSAGIVAGNFTWRAPHIWLAAFVFAALGVAILYRHAPTATFLLAFAAIVPLGAFYLQVSDAA